MLDKEPTKDFLDYPWLTWIFMVGFAVWGGLANLIQRYKQSRHRRFSLTEAIGELTISAFAGIVVYQICDAFGVHKGLTGAFVGVAGHMGSRLIYVLELWLKEKLGGYLGIKDPSNTPELPSVYASDASPPTPSDSSNSSNPPSRPSEGDPR